MRKGPSLLLMTLLPESGPAARIRDALRLLGHRTLPANRPGEAQALSAAHSPDAMVVDAFSPGFKERVETAASIESLYGLPWIAVADAWDEEALDVLRRRPPSGSVALDAGLDADPASLRLAIELAMADGRKRKASESGELGALRASEAKYRLLAENAEDVIWTLDNQLRFTYISPSVANLRGLSPEEAMGQTVEESMTPESFAVVREAFMTWAKLRSEGQRDHFTRLELEQYRKDGSTVWLECTVRPVLNDNGEQTGYVGVSRDIGERRRAERALRESEERFRSLWDALPHAAEELDATGRILFVNRNFAGKYGTEGIPGKKAWECCVGPGEADMAERFFRDAAFLQPDPEPFYGTLVDKDGRRVDARINWDYRRDPEGRVTGFVAVRTDLTRATRAEAALRESEERFEALFKYSPELAALTTMEGVYQEVNDAFLEATGYSREELIGKSSRSLNLWADPSDRDRLLSELKQGRPVIAMELSVRRKDGFVWPALFSAAAVDIAGERRLLTLALDISERKRLEEETLKARDEAVAASKAKTAFLARISHEIRTPMNSILGLAEMLSQANGLTDRQRGHADNLIRAGEHLLGIINNVLDFSAIEAGRLILEEKPFSPRSIMTEVAGLLSSLARDKGLVLHTEVSIDAPRLVLGDGGRLRQILMNLGVNAIKYSQQGRVTLRCDAARDDAGRPVLAFEVADQGAGIPEEASPYLFKEFSRAPGASGHSQGSGLGLAIVKALTEGMGGSIGYESVPGKGSRFFFTLPLPACEPAPGTAECVPAPPPGGTPSPDIKRRKALLVEDNPANVVIVTLFLEELPFDIATAENGAQAVALYQDNAYDVILMDIDMPLMDGREAAQLIRTIEREENRPHVPIIALTAHAFSEYRDMMARAGCDDYLAKPIRKKDLIDAIMRLTGGPEPHPGGPAREDASAGAVETECINPGLKPIIPAFLEIQKKNLERMNEALRQENSRDLRRLGHNLRGAALTYGFSRMAVFAESLEEAALAGDFSGAASVLQDLTKHFNNVHIVYGAAPDAGPDQDSPQ